MMNFTAIDFETANEKRSSACALGIVCVEDNIVKEQCYYLIQPPDLYFNPFNVAIHGIRKSDVIDKPNFHELWPSLKHYFENNIVIAHNASFDMSVLRATLDYYKIPFPKLQYGCTWMMSKKEWPDRLSHKLNDIAAMLDFSFEHHHALEDANACAQIAIHILDKNSTFNIDELSATLGFSMGSLYPGGYTPASASSKNRCKKNSGNQNVIRHALNG